jgi:hypothetical protein
MSVELVSAIVTGQLYAEALGQPAAQLVGRLKPRGNVGFLTLADIIQSERRALEWLVNAAIRERLLEETAPERLSLEPLLPKTDFSGAKFIETVSANNYFDDGWTVRVSVPSGATSLPPMDLVSVKTRSDAIVIAFGGLALDANAYAAVHHIYFYRDLGKRRMRYAVDVSRAVRPQDYPLYFISFGGQVVTVRDGEELAIELHFSDSWVQANAGASVNMKVVLLPPVKIIPRAASSFETEGTE